VASGAVESLDRLYTALYRDSTGSGHAVPMTNLVPKTETLNRAPEKPDEALGAPMVVERTKVGGSTRRKVRRVSPCGHQDCLEVAILGADYCPLHD
jgi:hypothetical protein